MAALADAAADSVAVEVPVATGDVEPLEVRLDVMSGEPENDVVALGHVVEDCELVTDTVAVVESVKNDADDVGEADADDVKRALCDKMVGEAVPVTWWEREAPTERVSSTVDDPERDALCEEVALRVAALVVEIVIEPDCVELDSLLPVTVTQVDTDAVGERVAG